MAGLAVTTPLGLTRMARAEEIGIEWDLVRKGGGMTSFDESDA